MWRARHLQDDRLYECYVARQTGEPVDPRAAEHLADCQACRERYAELSGFMGELRADADVEIDDAYSAEALRAQQSHILNRIEHLSHAARVISFPKHQATGSVPGETFRVAPRWLAAAAAAGLVVGVGVGTVLQSPFARRAPVKAAVTASLPSQTAGQPVAQPAAVEQATTPVSTNAVDASDEFFSALEVALQRSQTPELVALDDLTPHAREISFTSASYR
ncbi:MAG TPA: hypothetical protein VHZ73_00220 [Vicinamibacterales bacterium]|jgi:anti-sigma factor RsiW|nr:hypothetical protein [Vicinamibacterales bacterium]